MPVKVRMPVTAPRSIAFATVFIFTNSQETDHSRTRTPMPASLIPWRKPVKSHVAPPVWKLTFTPVRVDLKINVARRHIFGEQEPLRSALDVTLERFVTVSKDDPLTHRLVAHGANHYATQIAEAEYADLQQHASAE
jgi:hypothetical protein